VNPALEERESLRDRLQASLDRALAGGSGTIPLSPDDIKRGDGRSSPISRPRSIRKLEGGDSRA